MWVENIASIIYCSRMNPTPLLRRMDPQEYRHYSAFSFASFAKESSLASGEPFDAVRARFGSPPEVPDDRDLWFVIDLGGKTIGFIWIQLLAQPGHAFGYEIQLDEAYRGQGIGRQVMLVGQKVLRDHEIHKLQICVFATNAPARALYASLGFREVKFKPEKKQFTLEIDIPPATE